VKNEPRRLATIYAQGHHAREQGDPAKAYDLSLAAAELAQELGVQGLHDAALAEAGLAAMALGKWTEVEVVAARLTSSAPRITQSWFPGREIVEAFLVRYTMAAGDRERATTMFLGATSAVQGDPYASAWLAAECATLVRGGGERVVRDVLHRAMAQAQRHGFEPIVRRLAAAMRVTSPTEPVPSLEHG
jgi:hypothetical protein